MGGGGFKSRLLILLGFIVCTQPLALAKFQLPTTVEISDAVYKLNAELDEIRKTAPTTSCDQADPVTSLDSAPFATNKSSCPLDVDRWCQDSGNLCTTRYGKAECTMSLCPIERVTPLHLKCMAAELKFLKRMSTASQKEILKHAADLFYMTVQDPVVLDKCCKKDKSCRKQLSKAKLLLVEPVTIRDKSAYSVNGNTYFSRAVLVQHMTKGSMDHGILHEIGHLCQFARHANDNFRSDYVEPAKLSEVYAANALDYKEVWGSDIKDCLENAQGLSANDPRLTARLIEAFADVFGHSIHPSLNANPEFFGGMCFSGVDDAHGPPRAIMKCVAKHNPDVRNLCPGGSQ